MKKSIIACVAALAFAGSNLVAVPVSIPSNHLLGTVVPSTPANPANESGMVNFLVNAYNLGTSTGTLLGDNPNDPQLEIYKLIYTPGIIPNPAPLAGAGIPVVTSNKLVPLGAGGSYNWLFAKYGQNGQAYYIGDLAGDIVLPNRGVNGGGLSGYTFFGGSGPNSTQVPDGGITALLLGSVMAGFGLITRRIKK
jgi:hypothetical protein